MKKRKSTAGQSYIIANAIAIKNESGFFQYYKGDFFSLFVTQPAIAELHHCLKNNYVDFPVYLLFQNNDFIFEITIDRSSIIDYETIKDCDNLGKLVPFWSIGMEKAVKSFFNTTLKGPLADRFLYARVIDLIVQLVHHIEAINSTVIDPKALEDAEKAKQIILDDLSVYDTVERIARKVGIPEGHLQLAFKQRFGMTVGKFSKDERMKFAHDMLERTNDILLSVALAVGYNDPGNFSVAFKNYYGYSPGYIQRKKKLYGSHNLKSSQ